MLIPKLTLTNLPIKYSEILEKFKIGRSNASVIIRIFQIIREIYYELNLLSRIVYRIFSRIDVNP